MNIFLLDIPILIVWRNQRENSRRIVDKEWKDMIVLSKIFYIFFMTTAEEFSTGLRTHSIIDQIRVRTGRKPGLQSEIGLLIFRQALNKFLSDVDSRTTYKEGILPASEAVLILDELSESGKKSADFLSKLDAKQFTPQFKAGLSSVLDAMNSEKTVFESGDAEAYLRVSSVSSAFDIIMEFAFKYESVILKDDLIVMRNIFRIFSDASTTGKDAKHKTPNLFLIKGVSRDYYLSYANRELEIIRKKYPSDSMVKVGVEVLTNLQEIYYYRQTRNLFLKAVGFFLNRWYKN
jgi:hypothetical protein